MGKRPILIADPDSRVASMVVHGLRKEGFQVVTAQSGENALALLASLPALIFGDDALPVVDGLTLCRHIKKEPATANVPFFLLSRRSDPDLRERALAAGADDFLVKPLYVRDVCTLAHLFADQRAGDPVLHGDLGKLPLFYVLRALTSGARSGRVETSGEQGLLHFREGKIIEASAGTLVGEAAIARLLMLAQGPFTVELGPVLLEGSVSYSLCDLVTCDEPRRKRFERALATMGGPEVRFAIDPQALTRELPRLPASAEKIARLFDGTRTLREALRVSDLDEVVAAETILSLRTRGILTLSRPSPPRPTAVEPLSDEAILSMNALFPEASSLFIAGRPQPAPHPGSHAFAPAAPHGGWFEQPAAVAGKHLRQVVGELAAADIEHYLAGLDRLARSGPVDDDFDTCVERSFLSLASLRPLLILIAAVIGTLALVGYVAFKKRPPGTLSVVLALQPVEPEHAAPVVSAPIAESAPSSPERTSPPAEVAALIAQGKSLYERGRAHAALVPLESAANLAADNVDLQVLLALARLDAHQPLLAESAAHHALMLDPKNARAYLVLGTVHQELGEKAKARQAYQKILELEPRGGFSTEVRAILESGL